MNATRGEVRVWAIIPAAGTGQRMGGPKQALPYRGATLTGTVVRTLLDAGATGIVVVTRTVLVDALKLPDDPRVTITFNDADSEMIDSIRVGLGTLADQVIPSGDDARPTAEATPPALSRQVRSAQYRGPDTTAGVMVVPGDMPTLTADTCRRCIDAYKADPRRVVIAAYSRRRGHPIIFPLSMRDLVDRLQGGLNELPRLVPKRVYLVEVDDPGVACDVDTLADYDSLRGR